ncbi:hypothetical protein ACN28S_34285 [Cystobacter fuscus]
MRGNLSESRVLVMEALPRARTRADMASAYILQSELLRTSHSATVSMECLLECLAKLGMSLPLTPPRGRSRRWKRSCGRCWRGTPSRASSSCPP